MFALVDANREEILHDHDAIDGRDLMDFDVMKWNRISKRVMVAGFLPLVQDGASCKGKWHKILPNYWLLCYNGKK